MAHPDIRVAIVEDQERTREGLATLIDGTPGFHTIGKFDSMEAALRDHSSGAPDVVLLTSGCPECPASRACAS